ncbi:hypothetical protein NBRC116188_02460 [Oceaniserpentilla sp. 4NH20-0058]
MVSNWVSFVSGVSDGVATESVIWLFTAVGNAASAGKLSALNNKMGVFMGLFQKLNKSRLLRRGNLTIPLEK